MHLEKAEAYLRKTARTDLACTAGVFLLVFGATLLANVQLWHLILRFDIQYTAVFSTLFDLNSVLLAFMFSYFAFLKTSDNDFLKAAKKTTSYRILGSRLVATMQTSSLFALVTLIVIAVKPVVGETLEFQSFLFAAWVALISVLVFKFVQLNQIFWLFIGASE